MAERYAMAEEELFEWARGAAHGQRMAEEHPTITLERLRHPATPTTPYERGFAAGFRRERAAQVQEAAEQAAEEAAAS